MKNTLRSAHMRLVKYNDANTNYSTSHILQYKHSQQWLDNYGNSKSFVLKVCTEYPCTHLDNLEHRQVFEHNEGHKVPCVNSNCMDDSAEHGQSYKHPINQTCKNYPCLYLDNAYHCQMYRHNEYHKTLCTNSNCIDDSAEHAKYYKHLKGHTCKNYPCLYLDNAYHCQMYKHNKDHKQYCEDNDTCVLQNDHMHNRMWSHRKPEDNYSDIIDISPALREIFHCMDAIRIQ